MCKQLALPGYVRYHSGPLGVRAVELLLRREASLAERLRCRESRYFAERRVGNPFKPRVHVLFVHGDQLCDQLPVFERGHAICETLLSDRRQRFEVVQKQVRVRNSDPPTEHKLHQFPLHPWIPQLIEHKNESQQQIRLLLVRPLPAEQIPLQRVADHEAQHTVG